MWPLERSQLVRAIAPLAEPAEATVPMPGGVVEHAIAWAGVQHGPTEVFFAIEPALQGQVPAALAAGAIAVVASTFAGELARLPAEARSRCLVAPQPLAAYRRLAGFLRERFTFPVVAVGGSNGKTTTKEMVADLLEHASGGAVPRTPGTNNGWSGVPVTLCHPAHAAPAPFATVIEIGIDEVGAMAEHVALARPDLAVLTALGPEHLAGLGSHADAIREELLLFEGAKRRIWLLDEPALLSRATMVRDDDVVVRERTTARPEGTMAPELVYTWRSRSATTGELELTWAGETFRTLLPLPGIHNGRNAALAVAAALALGCALKKVVEGVAKLRGPKQRCAIRALASGAILVDDTYNASPSSFAAALAVLTTFPTDRRRVLVLGDMLDLGDAATALHSELVPPLAAIEGADLRFFGDHMAKVARSGDFGRSRSVGHAAPSEDPCSLLDMSDLEQAVVLVKGSRGMKLERVVAAVEARADADVRAWTEASPRVALAGDGVEPIATVLRARGVRGTSVRVFDPEMLASGATVARPSDVAVVGDLTRLLDAASDAEATLAAFAQLVLHLRPGAVVGFLPFRNSEIRTLLEGIVPPSATCVRGDLSTEAVISLVISRGRQAR